MAKKTVRVTPQEAPEQKLQRLTNTLGVDLPAAQELDRSVVETVRDLRTEVDGLFNQLAAMQALAEDLNEKYALTNQRFDNVRDMNIEFDRLSKKIIDTENRVQRLAEEK